MRLSSALGLGGISVCIMGVLAVGGEVALSTGCSSSSGGSSGGGSSGDTCQSAGVQCTVQPAAPSGGSPTSATHNYAMYTLYLGDTDRTGVTNSTAWESYGYNLDNLVTTKSSSDVCTLATGASKTTQSAGLPSSSPYTSSIPSVRAPRSVAQRSISGISSRPDM